MKHEKQEIEGNKSSSSSSSHHHHHQSHHHCIHVPCPHPSKFHPNDSPTTSSQAVLAALTTCVLSLLVALCYLYIAFVVIDDPLKGHESLTLIKSSSNKQSINDTQQFKPLDGPLVRTTTGKIRGRYLDILGKKISSFQGIPYATPPTGSLRFSRPQPVIPWKGILDVSSPSPACLQFSSSSIELPWIEGRPKVAENEDCLTLNIWRPDIKSGNGSGRAILIWIHGGGFVSGHSRMLEFDGSFLSSFTDSIVVTFNYRVGMFGFLNLHNSNINGNMGLYDQVMAIEWVKDNAHSFGGDPSLITLFGESAGAACVGFHLMSPLSRDLFSRGIMQSGSPLMPISLVSRYQEDIVAKDVLNMTGCHPSLIRKNSSSFDIDPDDQILRCLQSLPSSTLLSIQSVIVKRKDDTTFSPSFGDDFLPENPFDSIKMKESFGSGEKEVLLGYNRDEGSVFMYFANPLMYPAIHNSTKFNGTSLNNIDNVKSLNMSLDHLTSFAVRFMKTQDPGATATLVKSLYSNLLPTSNSSTSQSEDHTTQLFNETRINVGEFFIVCPTILAADDFSRLPNMSVFVYHFNHRPKNTPWAEWVGTAHFEEVQFVFGLPLRFPSKYTKEEVKLSKKIMSAWANFARTGKPDVPSDGFKWPAYRATTEERNYVDLSGRGGLRIRVNPPHKKCDMWRLTFEVSRSTITTSTIRSSSSTNEGDTNTNYDLPLSANDEETSSDEEEDGEGDDNSTDMTTSTTEKLNTSTISGRTKEDQSQVWKDISLNSSSSSMMETTTTPLPYKEDEDEEEGSNPSKSIPSTDSRVDDKDSTDITSSTAVNPSSRKENDGEDDDEEEEGDLGST